MSKIIGSTMDNGCKKIYLSQSGIDETPPTLNNGKVSVTQSVGLKSVNLPPDVRKIQDALNRVSPAGGGASPPLKIDGLCGPKTTKAIQQFQIKQFGWSGADGKINPNGQTITRLNELLFPASKTIAKDDTATQIFKNAMQLGIIRAGQMVVAALNEIDRAAQVIEMKDEIFPTLHSRADKMRLLNRYFRIDEFQYGGEKSLWLQHIRRIFVTMQLVLNRPGGVWGTRGFQVDDSGIRYKADEKLLAWATVGGFFLSGEMLPPPLQQFRDDTIYFVRENIIWQANTNYAGYAIVHEMAHFCGNTEAIGSTIDDFDAYGEPEAPAVFLLRPWQHVRHADSYARFAKACLEKKS